MYHDAHMSFSAARTFERQEILEALEILDTLPEPHFDAITELAARIFECPIGLVSLITSERQWFKSRRGFDAHETPIEHSICRHVVERGRPLLLENAATDEEFGDNLYVAGPSHVRFYAGVPLRVRPYGNDVEVAVGTLCVLDIEPHEAAPGTIETLERLGAVVEALLTARLDAVKARKHAEECAEALQANERLYRQLSQAERMANLGSWRLCLETEKVEWSDQVYAIHGLTRTGTVPVEQALQFYPPEHRSMLDDAIEVATRTGKPYDLEVDFTNARDEKRRVRAMGEVELQDGRPVALIGVFQDITARYEMEQALRHAADTDDLTRIASRRHFNRQVEQAIDDAVEKDSALAAVLIDLDHFKAVNDNFGHATGDNVLRWAATQLRAPWLKNSFAARLGGDEFVLLITDAVLIADLPGTIACLLDSLKQDVGDDDGRDISIRVSATIGAACLDHDDATRRNLLESADAALYRAKEDRRGTARIADREGSIG